MTGDVFSIIYGDLVTEVLNKETKFTSDSFHCRFSTNINSVNIWVNTIHIRIMLEVTLRQQLHLKTTSKHKELIKGGKELHSPHVKSLKKKLSGYRKDPFTFSFSINSSSGEKIVKNVYNNSWQVEILEKKIE